MQLQYAVIVIPFSLFVSVGCSNGEVKGGGGGNSGAGFGGGAGTGGEAGTRPPRKCRTKRYYSAFPNVL